PADWVMKMDEVTLYASVWLTGGIWHLPPNPIPIDYVTRAVALWRGGEAYILDPALGEPPSCWINPPDKEIQIVAPYSVPVVIRHSPDEVVPGDVIPVSIEVSSAGNASGYAVEERCPDNCTINSVNDGGHFDSA